MTTIKIIRLLQLSCYAMITSQLLFYLLVLCDAFRLIPLEHFLEQRKAVDAVISGRYKIIYYSCLLLSIVAAALSVKNPYSPEFLASAVALLCLVADMAIAIKGNIPLNAQVNAYVAGAPGDWEAVRLKWLAFMRYRGILTSIGMLSLFIGLLFGKSGTAPVAP